MSGADRRGLRYRFAGFELEPCERRCSAHRQPVTPTPKVFDTLMLLVEHAGRMVGKDERMAALWPRGSVSASNLVEHIRAIRAIFPRRAALSASAANLDRDAVRAALAGDAVIGAGPWQS